jgi:uncharacterized protein involved in response to NO
MLGPIDPYRVLFPVGAFLGLLGSAVWVLFWLEWLPYYPGALHPDLMVGGFLFIFASGFLMTAIPRFSGSFVATIWEIAIAMAFALTLCFVSLRESRLAFHLVSLLALAFLSLFFGKRLLHRTHTLFPIFLFVGVGLFCGVLGCGFLLLSDLGLVVTARYVVFGRVLYYQGMMLGLILGVGLRLVPAIMGYGPLVCAHASVKGDRKLTEKHKLILAACIFIVSFALEAFVQQTLGRTLRALLLTGAMLRALQLFQLPRFRNNLTFGLWFAGWMTIAGLWLYTAWPSYSIHGLHLLLIGGLSLMTLMVGARVTLSHGAFGTEFEKSPWIGWLVLLIALSGIVRFLAPFAHRSYFMHLATAAFLWLFAMLIWAVAFIPRMSWRVTQQKS